MNFWEQIGKPKLYKSFKIKTDESCIKTLGYFEETFEMNIRIEIVVVDCNKSYGLKGTDLLKVNSMESTNPENKIVKDYKANIERKL